MDYCYREIVTEIRQKVTGKNVGSATSADVQRSFSLYENLLAPNTRRFVFENLKIPLIVQCNNYFKGEELKFNVVGDGVCFKFNHTFFRCRLPRS